MSVHTDADDRGGARAPEAGPGPQPAPRARILVVDDEPLVGLVIQRAFEEHEVVLADSARAALEMLDAGERFDVLCSDLMMPDMDGAALHAEVALRDPTLARRTVFLTGGAYTEEALASLEAAHAEVLEKPFELSTLRALVDRLLASARAG